MIAFALSLVLAHLLGDFAFQPDSWVEHKKEHKLRSPYLYLHIVVHGAALLLLLQFDLSYWKAIVLITLSHFIIDVAKLYLQEKWNSNLLFFADQLLHLLMLAWAVSLYYPFVVSFGWLAHPRAQLLLAALIAVSYASAVVIRIIMSGLQPEENDAAESIKHAGKYIGILERLLVFGFILLGQWAAIGFLIAAKSILRFSDLSRAKDRKLTEYILIGTLLSFGLAIGISLLYTYLDVLWFGK